MVKMHSCFAVTAPGLEHLTAAELRDVGAAVNATEPGGVSFEAAPGILYAANLHVRTASRIVVRIAQFHAASFADLEKQARRVAWARWVAGRRGGALSRDQPEVAALPPGRGGGAAGARRAGGHPRRARGPRPVRRRRARRRRHRAPRRAALPRPHRGRRAHPQRRQLAARSSTGAATGWPRPRRRSAKRWRRRCCWRMEWDGSTPLVDPLCGSGTIPIEAALLARRIPPGWRRRFAFESWPEFKPSVWEYVRGEAEKEILERARRADRGRRPGRRCRGGVRRQRGAGGGAGDLSIVRGALDHPLRSRPVGPAARAWSHQPALSASGSARAAGCATCTPRWAMPCAGHSRPGRSAS